MKNITELSLSTQLKDLEECILEEENLDELKDITKLFNVNLKKRD